MRVDAQQVLADLIEIVRSLSEWESTTPITRDSWFFADLGFESIDAVVLGESVEAHYRRRFPYAQFLADIGQRDVRDVQVGEVVDFVLRCWEAPGARAEVRP